MKKTITVIKHFLSERFNLMDDKADDQQVMESITKEVTFKGTNVWTLIFAIFIASIGLNVNSTAVIIGAMLISPLMGPIMGIGLAIGINDFELLKKALKNLFIAAVISVATSCIYFAITPLRDASPELLARTSPSVWDVFIALFGGLAGIVAGTRREKSNVIPGVAIATALMPPLCTAGYGLATGQWYYSLGALYLFFINSLFICLATVLIVKHLKFHKKEFATPEREKRVSTYMLIIVTITVLPSIYLAYRIVQKSIFERNAKRYVQHEFHFTKTQVVTHAYNYSGKKGIIDLLLVGQPLTDLKIDSLRSRMHAYGLDSVQLIIHQGLDAKQQIDLSEIKASVLEEVFAAGRKQEAAPPGNGEKPTALPDIKKEVQALYPGVVTYALHTTGIISADSARHDTVTYFIAKFNQRLKTADKIKLQQWLKQRLGVDSVKVVVE